MEFSIELQTVCGISSGSSLFAIVSFSRDYTRIVQATFLDFDDRSFLFDKIRSYSQCACCLTL